MFIWPLAFNVELILTGCENSEVAFISIASLNVERPETLICDKFTFVKVRAAGKVAIPTTCNWSTVKPTPSLLEAAPESEDLLRSINLCVPAPADD